MLSKDFDIRDVGLPTGTDQRFLLTHKKILEMTNGMTRSVWLFIDIKSVGPRDDQDHAVMSHNQVSGSGDWVERNAGLFNKTLHATGARANHDFHVSIPPLYVLSNLIIAPTVIIALKPVYNMLPSTQKKLRNDGQPLARIDLACIPNGILLTQNPSYLDRYPSLFFPGKDDKSKDPRKLRARVDFALLREIAYWRYQSIIVDCR